MVSITTKEWKIDNIEGVLFDKDGTLIDSHIYWGRIIERRSNAIIKYYSLSNSLFYDLCLTMGYSVEKKELVPEGPIALVSREEVIQILNRFLISIGIHSTIKEISELFNTEHEAFINEILDYIKFLPNVKDFLIGLKHHDIRTAIITTDSVKNTKEILRHFEIDFLFNIVIGKESTKESKITGIPAVKALQLLGLKQEETVCIGDAPMDLIMAKNSGLKAGIGVATGQIKYHDLQRYTPYVILSMNELKVADYIE